MASKGRDIFPYSTGNVYFDKNTCRRCSIFPMGDISRGADTLLTAVFGEHPKLRRLHAIVNGNTRDHRDAAQPP
ncbi:hypothetical protein DPMN_171559 [Dreissena polymorpha]|uniref:Uncharacterized protein n=1 Tax=Dreissena polymorpha TaxID=45954 RepID=A0A9D4E0M7_DREPO|nr:hypothetical protein DPMN_171559 [Dreissena polymorpha]